MNSSEDFEKRLKALEDDVGAPARLLEASQQRFDRTLSLVGTIITIFGVSLTVVLGLGITIMFFFVSQMKDLVANIRETVNTSQEAQSGVQRNLNRLDSLTNKMDTTFVDHENRIRSLEKRKDSVNKK